MNIGSRPRLLAAASAIALLGIAVSGRQGPPASALKTPAETTGFAAASAYGDVMTFLTAVSAAAPRSIHLTTMGTTTDGRAMPLVVVGPSIADATPAAVRGSGKLRVWINAGSHGDDLDGTEATLALIRDLAAGRHAEWLESVVLLVSPLANPDGRERVAVGAPPFLNGPPGDVGQRMTASGVDLDGDATTLRSPEAQAAAKIWVDYDPLVLIDLHTTAWSCSGYVTTYAPPMHPGTSERVLAPLRNEWLPFITRNLKVRRTIDAFYRGRVSNGDDGCGSVPAPTTTAPAATSRRGSAPAPPAGRGARGRTGAAAPPAKALPITPTPAPPPPVTAAWTGITAAAGVAVNYAGLRNRFAIDGESYAYAAFAERVAAAGFFVEEAVSFVYAAGTRLKKATEDADADLIVGRSQATTAKLLTGTRIEVLMGSVDVIPNPANAGAPIRHRAAMTTTVPMIDRMWFEPATDEIAAAEYYIPSGLTSVLDLLKAHGVQLRQLTQPSRGVEEFVVTPAPGGRRAGRPLAGGWQPAGPAVSVPASTWVVRMNQPLARLAFALLEPASEDGLAATGLTGEAVDGSTTYPILRKR